MGLVVFDVGADRLTALIQYPLHSAIVSDEATSVTVSLLFVGDMVTLQWACAL